MPTVVYLRPSTKKEKKYMVYVNGKTVHFGAAGMSDYTKHKDPDRKRRYDARHSRGGETWTKSGLTTAGFWSKWLLWNKPSFQASKQDMARRFGLQFRSGWPVKSGSNSRIKFAKKKSMKKSRRKLPKKSSRKSYRKTRKSK
jgi:hypothetical protein